jgi:hypothetical protein
MEAGTRARGTGEWWVDDPDVCGLWFQESLPLCMVINPFVLFSIYFDSGVVLWFSRSILLTERLDRFLLWPCLAQLLLVEKAAYLISW